MVKFTVDKISSKLGRKVDLKTLNEFSLTKASVDEVGSFSNMSSLITLDFSGNLFKHLRQIQGLLEAPALKSLDLSGAAVCKLPNYRFHVIAHCPYLEILDGLSISEEERTEAYNAFPDLKPANYQEKKAKEKNAKLEEEQLFGGGDKQSDSKILGGDEIFAATIKSPTIETAAPIITTIPTIPTTPTTPTTPTPITTTIPIITTIPTIPTTPTTSTTPTTPTPKTETPIKITKLAQAPSSPAPKANITFNHNLFTAGDDIF